VDLLRQGLHFRGLREFDRQNFGKAYEAFKSAGNYRDSLFQMAEIIRQTSQPIPEIAAHYWAAYDAGDKGALPWLCTLENGIAYESKVEHPRFKEITAELEALREAHDPDIARELSRLSFQIGELTEGLRYLTAAVLLGDPKSRILFADLLTMGPISPSLTEVYKLMLDKNIFDLKGFPFEPELIPLSSPDSILTGDDLDISDEMSKLLFWLYDQGDSELRTSGLLMRRLLQEMSVSGSYDLFAGYHNQFKNSFGFKGEIWSDITFIFDVAANLLQVSKKPDLTIYEYLTEKFGVRDLFDELVRETLSSQAEASYDGYFWNIKSFTYKSNFSMESAKSQIPIDFQLPSVESFMHCVDKLDFNSAEEIFSKVLSDAKSDLHSACEELACLLELIDRLKFEFDVLPKRFVAFAFDSVISAIKEDKSETLRRTLTEFRPNGERPYFMDDLEFELLGQKK
jgi:hypothetical protein